MISEARDGEQGVKVHKFTTDGPHVYNRDGWAIPMYTIGIDGTYTRSMQDAAHSQVLHHAVLPSM